MLNSFQVIVILGGNVNIIEEILLKFRVVTILVLEQRLQIMDKVQGDTMEGRILWMITGAQDLDLIRIIQQSKTGWVEELYISESKYEGYYYY